MAVLSTTFTGHWPVFIDLHIYNEALFSGRVGSYIIIITDKSNRYLNIIHDLIVSDLVT